MSSRNVHKDKQNEVLQTRTGVIVPATRLGVRDDGLEDPDEFFASAKDTSPTTDLVGKEKLSLEKKKPNGDMLDSKRPKRNVFSSVCDDNETFIPTQTSIRNLRRQLRLKWNESTTGTNELSSVSTASQLPALPISIIKKPVILQDQDHLSDLKRNFEGDFEEEIKISSVGGSTKNSLFDHDFNHSFVEEFIQGDTSNSQIQDEIQQQSISWSKELVSRDYLITDNVMSTMKGNSRTPVPVTNNQRARSRSGSSKTPSFEIYEDPDPLSFNQDFETDIVSPITMQDDDKENYPSSRERTPTTSTRNMTVAGTKENDDESKSTSSEHVDELKQSIKKPSMEDDIDSPQEAIGFQLSTPHSSVNKKRDSTSRKSSSTNTSKPRSSGTYRSNASTEEEDETLLVSVPKPRPINRKLPMQQRDCSKEKLKNDLYNVATKIRNEQGTPKRKNPKKRFNPYATVFQSQGIPLPRTFHVIPISDLPSVSSPADNIALRRSKRAKVKPLDFWKGECIEYGPNEFGDEYEGVTNMSVPIFVRKAETTPHKPRNCSMNGSKIKSKKMNSKGKTFTNDEVGIFDDKKLRKKYNYVDNEKAEIWNETTSECDVMSKYILFYLK